MSTVFRVITTFERLSRGSPNVAVTSRTMSCHLPENLAEANVTLDLKPGLTAQQLDTRLQRELAEDSRRQLRNVLPHLLPASFAEIFPELCGVDGSKVCAQVTKEEREKLVSALKALPIPLKKLAPIEEAIVTRGGKNARIVEILAGYLRDELNKKA